MSSSTAAYAILVDSVVGSGSESSDQEQARGNGDLELLVSSVSDWMGRRSGTYGGAAVAILSAAGVVCTGAYTANKQSASVGAALEQRV